MSREYDSRDNERDRGKSSRKGRSREKSRQRSREDDQRDSSLPEISAEDKHRAMLGYTMTSDGSKMPYLYREDFCGCCGIQHPSPSLLDNYGCCYSCFNTLREPAVLRKRFKDIPYRNPLDILYATYGDPVYSNLAFDVTEILQRRVDEGGYFKDRMHFKTTEDLSVLFGRDPNVGNNKQLRIRYRMGGVHGTACLDVMPNNHFPSYVMFLSPKERHLRIIKASYGFPKGISSDGRMSYDATELVQGIVDTLGGSYLFISSNTPLTRIFGDPCPGYTKDLRVRYEVCGRFASETYDEIRGHLRRRVFIEQAPSIAPVIIITSAFYGITPTGRKDYLESINKELRKCHAIQHKISTGMIPTPAELQQLKKYNTLEQEKEAFQKAPTLFLDVTDKMQKIADAAGLNLILEKGKFDPNKIFSNPCPGNVKLLEVNIDCPGHDSERETDSKDMTASGHPRNFITSKTARFVVPVRDGKHPGESVLLETIQFSTDFAAPIIRIEKAIFGYFKEITKTVDVTAEIQAMVTGRMLKIERSVDLCQALRCDPCPGIRKQLKIDYTTRGFSGNLRVKVNLATDCLAATISVGYPPCAPRDPAEDF